MQRFKGWMYYWHRWTKVMTRYHLVRPLLHAHHAPEYTARGLAVGMLVALTPTFGAQIAIVMAIWTILKVVRPAWDFNAVVASAWIHRDKQPRQTIFPDVMPVGRDIHFTRSDVKPS